MSLPAIILAAGLSSRMAPRFKPLLPYHGQPLIAHVLQILSSTCSPLLLVTGHRADEVQQAASSLPPRVAGELARRSPSVTPIHNPDYESGGMLSSIQAGLRALPPNSPAFLLSLGDQPTILPSTLAHLLHAWHASHPLIALPTHLGQRGHPLLLSAACIPDLLALAPPQTLKTFTQRHPAQILQVPVHDPGILTDIDTPPDYDRLINPPPPAP